MMSCPISSPPPPSRCSAGLAPPPPPVPAARVGPLYGSQAAVTQRNACPLPPPRHPTPLVLVHALDPSWPARRCALPPAESDD